MPRLNKQLKENDLDAIFSSIEGMKHILHLYSSAVNKYIIHASFLSNGDKAAYITGEDPESVKKRFDSLKTNLTVIHPKDLNQAIEFERVIIDGASITPSVMKTDTKRRGEKELLKEYLNHTKREQYINKSFTNQNILCTYNVTKLTPDEVKILINNHDKLILSTDSTTVLSSKNLSAKQLMNSNVMDEFVKRELKTIVLALLTKAPMCGREIKLEIYKKFNILLSSGTLYPLLHELEEKKLLNCKSGIKTKTYNPVDQKKIKKMIAEHIQAKNFLNSFLQSAMIKE